MRPTLTIALFAVSITAAAASQTTYQHEIDPNYSVQLDRTSPLTSDGQALYGIDASRQIVLTTGGLLEPFMWSPFVKLEKKGRIRSITASANNLYMLTDLGTIYRINIRTLSRSALMHNVPGEVGTNDNHPIPTQIVFAGTSLYALTERVSGHSALLPVFVEAEGGPRPDAMYFDNEKVELLAAHGDDIVGSVSDLQPGTIVQLNINSLKDGFVEYVVLGAQPQSQPKSRPDDIKSNFVRSIKPSAITVYDGEIYALDSSTHNLFVFSLHNRRPARIQYRDWNIADASTLLATRESLYILNGSDGKLLRLPRLIPAEIRFDPSADAAISLYRYLAERNILPIRTVRVSGGLGLTVEREQVFIDPRSVGVLLCMLNPSSCRDGEPTPMGDLNIPDVYAERVIDVDSITLHGQTLRQEVERAVTSPEFEVWKSEEQLRKLNDGLPNGERLLDAATGIYRIYAEKIRFVVAVYQQDLAKVDSPLQDLKKEFEGLSVTSLAESPASSPTSGLNHFGFRARFIERTSRVDLSGAKVAGRTSAAQTADGSFGPATIRQEGAQNASPQSQPPQTGPPSTLADADKQKLIGEYNGLLKTIHYGRPGGAGLFTVSTPRIGIAEDNIDVSDPDFDPQTFEALDQLVPEANSAAVPHVQSGPSLRDFDELDHGTSVAALIGARQMDFGGIGLAAPQVVMIPVLSKDPPIGEEIRQAELVGATIFNLSISFPDGVIPSGLQDAIDRYPDSLFVVAAGHHTKEACASALTTYYPLCWGEKPNVLTVAATGLDGTSLMDKITVNDRDVPGSDWSQRYIWVAAPGEGFHSAGRNRAYVPVRGTSFATPLVTATAALLYAEGIKSGPHIKLRIVYTADFKSNLKGKIVGGALLNVERALKYPRRSILIDNDGNETIADLALGGDNKFLVIPTDTDDLRIPIKNIRRLTRDGSRFRMIYVDHDVSTGMDVIRFLDDIAEPLASPWKFSYNEVDVTTQARSAKKQGDFANFKDFIGPVE